MSVTVNDVKHIANLCRLNVPDDEMDKFVEQFNQILNYAEILKESGYHGNRTFSLCAPHQQCAAGRCSGPESVP